MNTIANACVARARAYADECRRNGNQAGCLAWLKVADEWQLFANKTANRGAQ